ncbi:hypothetical protein L3049_04480 [Labilibaculum sp. DW002]|uniref:Uncharacterized protein n=1 Tax=Paralabilibaculum antarcticum TaxID=2912572 RepID=A0ABT5VPQ5_9BACT|nr:hypothetical protein [Labilibaculum sp. DW002]MDE5417256.1 hypothetical protein [Labilibaculum sp. DW002]
MDSINNKKALAVNKLPNLRNKSREKDASRGRSTNYELVELPDGNKAEHI